MKLFFLLLLLLSLSSVVASTTELTKTEKKDIQTFLKRYLGLTKEEGKIFSRIKILTSEFTSDEFVGFAHNDGSYRIELSTGHKTREQFLSTVVHEITHQVYYQIKGREEDIELEGVALLAEYLFLREKFGKDIAFRSFLPMVNSTLEKNNLGLVNFEKTVSDYGKSFLFMLFLYENFYQEDFISTHLHKRSQGLNGISETALMAKSFRLTPNSWKSPAFLTSTFFWSLINKKNMLTIKQGDLFTQLLSFALADIKDATEAIVPAFGQLIIQNKESLLIDIPAEITGYLIRPDFTKTFIQGNEVNLKKDERLQLLNLTGRDVSISLPPEEVTSNN